MENKSKQKYWLDELDRFGLFFGGIFLGGLIENIGIKNLSIIISSSLLVVLGVVSLLIQDKFWFQKGNKSKRPHPKRRKLGK